MIRGKNNIITVKGFKPYAHQRAVIKTLDEHPSGATIVIKSSRQKGKTLLLEQLLLRNALNIKGTNSVLLEPTTAGCRRVMKEIELMLKGIPVVKSANYQYLDLEFGNGSVIQFRSAEQGDNLRGISLKKNSLLMLDEAAFYDEAYGIVFPFANVHKNTKIICSTPTFKEGEYYKHYELARQGLSNHFLIDFNDFDTSMLLSPEQLEEARMTMSYSAFLNEYLGEFLELQGTVFGDFSKVISNNFNRNNNQFYMGVDWSQNGGNDNTAIAVFNSEKEMVRLVYFNEKGAFETIDEIVKLIKQYKPVNVACEMNSMGDTHYQMLVRALQNARINQKLTKFWTDNTSKRRIIENLAGDIEKGAVQILDDTEMKLELACYELEKTPGGKITYNAKKGYKDDCIMASAICLDTMRKSGYRVR